MIKTRGWCHLAVRIVVEREQEQTIGGSNPMQKERQATPIFFVVVSMGWLVDELVVG